MGLLDGMFGQVGQHVDIGNLAEKLGLPGEQVEQAIAALTRAHVDPGDTVQVAAQSTGLSGDVLQQIIAAVGGEGSLGRFAEMLGDDKGGAGGLGGMLGGLMGGKN